MLGDPAPTPFDRGLLRLGHDLRARADEPRLARILAEQGVRPQPGTTWGELAEVAS